MAEKFISYLRQEKQRLEQAIGKAETVAHPTAPEVKRLKALHRAVNEQIGRWMQDLYGEEPRRCQAAG